MFLAIYDGANFGADNFGEAVVITLVAMFLVFAILLILYVLISLLKKLNVESKEELQEAQGKVIREPLDFETMDEDMKVAALVATIDYKSELNEDAKLVSIKRIDE